MAVEPRRGCGYRKVGGKYLVSGGPAVPCGRLPAALHICPTCNQGVKQTRGWQWVEASLLAATPCNPELMMRTAPARFTAAATLCTVCPLRDLEALGRVGLLWVGSMFYPKAENFLAESRTQGVSRRIQTIPRGFVVGETWVLLAHPKAVWEPPADQGGEFVGKWSPGVFAIFRPERVEQLITKSEATRYTLAQLESQGITPVVVPDEDRDHQGTVFDEKPNGDMFEEEE